MQGGATCREKAAELWHGHCTCVPAMGTASRHPRHATDGAGDHDDPRPRVMVAEDDAALRRLLTRALDAAGYAVTSADTGPALLMSLWRAALHSRLPALIVSDIRMPGRSGLEVARVLRDKGWSVPVILITAFVDEDVVTLGQRVGAAAVLSKPFDLDDLLTEVARLAPCPGA